MERGADGRGGLTLGAERPKEGEDLVKKWGWRTERAIGGRKQGAEVGGWRKEGGEGGLGVN